MGKFSVLMHLPFFAFSFLIGPTPASNATNVQNDVYSPRDLQARDFGVKGDCNTDDSYAINNYIDYVRKIKSSPNGKFIGLVQLDANRCFLLRHPLNLTGITDIIFDGNSSLLIGNFDGETIIEAIQSDRITLRNFRLESQGHLKYGIRIGRALNGYTGAANVTLQNITIYGSFEIANFYNRLAETSLFENLFLMNVSDSKDSYSLIMDGDAHWPINSAFSSTYNKGNPEISDSLFLEGKDNDKTSFNEQTFIGSTFISSGGPAIWMSKPWRHNYIGSYVAGHFGNSKKGASTIIYVGQGERPHQLYWDVHSEYDDSDFMFSGPNIYMAIDGLVYRNNVVSSGRFIFSRSDINQHVSINNTSFSVGDWSNKGAVTFDDGNYWSGSGVIFGDSKQRFNSEFFSGFFSFNNGTSFKGNSFQLQPQELATTTLCSASNAGSIAVMSPVGKDRDLQKTDLNSASEKLYFCDGKSWREINMKN